MKHYITLIALMLPLVAVAQSGTPQDDTSSVAKTDCDCSNYDWDDYADLLDAEEAPCLYKCIKQRVSRDTWSTNLDFAWGFHNWGGTPFSGLGGMDGDAAVRTSFNHILLSLSYPVVISRRVALYAGLGLEWDKYKFHSGEVLFNSSLSPHRLTLGPDDATSRLLTRYFIVPISLYFDLGSHWKIEIAALPGLHWSGSHTGLRRDYTEGDNERHVKDYSINRHLNPFKLDARLLVRYRAVGLYFQVATLPAFRNTCEELYPVKFGITL